MAAAQILTADLRLEKIFRRTALYAAACFRLWCFSCRSNPVYPRAPFKQALRETVVLEFILDTEGRVHLPRCIRLRFAHFIGISAHARRRSG